ncbi:hypothetical protein DQ384_38500 [Sphaerisporangium album]|uniref:Uncharacterized protein n=1 Tax=Sphaerisporangium album TaxID=509200 RepID=A0A367ELN2_9ACTN|nr:hypothetical protein DQ384_38500 [Sphaerisporangium album]
MRRHLFARESLAVSLRTAQQPGRFAILIEVGVPRLAFASHRPIGGWLFLFSRFAEGRITDRCQQTLCARHRNLQTLGDHDGGQGGVVLLDTQRQPRCLIEQRIQVGVCVSQAGGRQKAPSSSEWNLQELGYRDLGQRLTGGGLACQFQNLAPQWIRPAAWHAWAWAYLVPEVVEVCPAPPLHALVVDVVRVAQAGEVGVVGILVHRFGCKAV